MATKRRHSHDARDAASESVVDPTDAMHTTGTSKGAASSSREIVPLIRPQDLAAALAGRVLHLFLDYDGTLAAIVDDPERAYITDACRDMLQKLAASNPVSLVSGRANAKLKSFVGSAVAESLYLAGSHGVDITGPRGVAVGAPDPAARVGADALAALAAARAALDAALGDLSGYLTEDNQYCLSAHYRRVAPREHGRVRHAVQEVLAQHPELEHKEGKMVHELRPRCRWDKGKAVAWLHAQLLATGAAATPPPATGTPAPPPAPPAPSPLPVYLGDDVADEEAFRMVAELGGLGIKVASGPVPRASTAATWSIPQTSVVELLSGAFLPEG